MSGRHVHSAEQTGYAYTLCHLRFYVFALAIPNLEDIAMHDPILLGAGFKQGYCLKTNPVQAAPLTFPAPFPTSNVVIILNK